MKNHIQRPAPPTREEYIRFCSHALMAAGRLQLAAGEYEGYDFPVSCRTVAAHAEKLCAMLRSLLPAGDRCEADAELTESLDCLGLPLPEFMKKEDAYEQ